MSQENSHHAMNKIDQLAQVKKQIELKYKTDKSSQLAQLAKVKEQIELRYKRINSADRRPSLEYVTVDEIRELFAPFSNNPDEFVKLPDTTLYDFYTQFYHQYRNDTQKNLEYQLEGIQGLLKDLEISEDITM